jgi:hypothetical protein
MWRTIGLGALLALGGLSPAISHAADDAAALRKELAAVKADYEARLAALEARLSRLEKGGAAPAAPTSPTEPTAPAQAAAAQPGAGQASAADESAEQLAAELAAQASSTQAPMDMSPAPVSSPSGNPATAFNPALSVILTGNYANLSEDPETWRIAGFVPSGGEVGPGERSFNLGESELTLASNVDPYFYAQVTAAMSPENELAVEEAFFRTIALPEGFTVKGGRFFSGIGYLNEVHAHAWDFIDQPLVYQAFFAGQLDQEGVQVKWIAPTDLFLEFGAEAGNGAPFPGTRRNRNGLNGTSLFAHVGGDIADSASWRAGISWLTTHPQDRLYEDSDDIGTPVLNAFSGRARTWVADATFKWAPAGNFARRYVKVQGEYMRRVEDGDLAFDTEGAGLVDDYRSRQSGWYVQSVYQFLPRWRAGMRYDDLDSGSTHIGLVDDGLLPAEAFPILLPASPNRISLMLDWNPSEFSRLRAQFAWDDARDAERERQLFLQYIYGIGAHGAHKY